MNRLAVLAIGAVLLLTMLPFAAAAARVRWVDDDGRAGPTSCRGTRAAPRSIQAAIDASGRNDTIRVCNGTYVGALAIHGPRHTGLQLRAVTDLGAAIVPRPASRSTSRRTLSIQQTSGVTVRGFDVRLPTSGSCREQREAIAVRQSRDVRIERNRILPRGSSTLGRCGYVTGVLMEISTGSVVGNDIVDFKRWGIRAIDGDYAITGNAVRFRHDDHTGREVAGAGIATDNGSIDVAGNVVTGISTRSFGRSGTPLLGAGIQVGEAGDTTVSGNQVRWVAVGLTLSSGAATVRENSIADTTYQGLSVLKSDNGGIIEGNRVSGSGDEGIYLRGPGKGIQVRGNDASGNDAVDCRDDTAAGGGTAGTGNTWTGNVGGESTPAGLCAP